ncbi:hypothetical protein ARSEF4850_008313 [Beauveria asiatica]
MSQHPKETKDGRYEQVDYCIFAATRYDRPMGWQSSKGSVSLIPEGSDATSRVRKSLEDNPNDVAPKNTRILVSNTLFYLKDQGPE